MGWYRKAAEQGYAPSMANLGACYYNGQGCPQSWKEAYEWFLKATDKGDANGQFSLGVLYKQGRYVEKNLYKAIECFQKAAEQGHENAEVLRQQCIAALNND